MNKLHVSDWLCALCAVLVCSVSQAATHSRAEQGLQSGFVMAQSCEKEIDDDMAFYEECVGHAISRVAGQSHVMLGLHFQAWLMADLAARQNSSRALILRKRHAHGLHQQLKATGMKLNQLCRAKKLSCSTVRSRMEQRFE
jgi:hypothetical protein